MTSRRSFLASAAAALASAAAALAYDPERELWVPGAKKIFVPALKQFGPISMYGPFTRWNFVWTFDEVVKCVVTSSMSETPTLVWDARHTITHAPRKF